MKRQLDSILASDPALNRALSDDDMGGLQVQQASRGLTALVNRGFGGNG